MDRARTLLYVTSLSFTAMLQILETRQVLFDRTKRFQELLEDLSSFYVIRAQVNSSITQYLNVPSLTSVL